MADDYKAGSAEQYQQTLAVDKMLGRVIFLTLVLVLFGMIAATEASWAPDF